MSIREHHELAVVASFEEFFSTAMQKPNARIGCGDDAVINVEGQLHRPVPGWMEFAQIEMQIRGEMPGCTDRYQNFSHVGILSGFGNSIP